MHADIIMLNSPMYACVTRVRRGLQLVAWLACVACSDPTQSSGPGAEPPSRIPTIGGQSGAEGSCLLPEVSELGFDPAVLTGRVRGEHKTELRWNASNPLHDGAADDPAPGARDRAVFDIAALGEPEVSLHCGGAVFQDVEVHMQIPNAGINVVFEATAQTLRDRPDVAFVWTELDQQFASIVRASAKDYARDMYVFSAGFNPTGVYFNSWISAHGFGGDLTAYSRGPAGSWGQFRACGLASWPQVRSCDTHGVPVPADTRFGDFEVSQALSALQMLEEQSVTWADGSQTGVRFELELTPEPLCVGMDFRRSADDIVDRDKIDIPVTLHVLTADGKLDASVPARLTVAVSASEGWNGNFELQADVLGTPAAFAEQGARFGAEIAAESLVKLHASMAHGRDEGGDRGSIRLSTTERDPDVAPPQGVIETGVGGAFTYCGRELAPQMLTEGHIGAR